LPDLWQGELLVDGKKIVLGLIDAMREKIEDQAREIERLEAWKAEEMLVISPLMDYARSACDGPLGCSLTEWLVSDHKRLAALKAQPSVVVLPEHTELNRMWQEVQDGAMRNPTPPHIVFAEQLARLNKPASANQCDGCLAGIPVHGGMHAMGTRGGYADKMMCTASRYQQPASGGEPFKCDHAACVSLGEHHPFCEYVKQSSGGDDTERAAFEAVRDCKGFEFFDNCYWLRAIPECPDEKALINADWELWQAACKYARAALPVREAVAAGWRLVPVEPTPDMVKAAEEAYMPFGDMDIALRCAMLTAPSPSREGE
jgi:hypothetical protein